MAEKLFDRRRSRRIGVALPVILENARAVTRDTSASSVFFWKRGTFMYGESIRFAIERSTERGKILQKCRGVVVRTEPDDDGVGVAAKITESTTERVPGQPPGPEMLESAHQGLRDIARPADNVPASPTEAVTPDPVRDEPPAIAPSADAVPASGVKTAVLGSSRDEPPTIVPPADHVPAPPEKTVLLESTREHVPTIAWPTDEALFLPEKTASRDTEREQLPTIAWPTDEAYFSPDKTALLDTAREQARANTRPFNCAPASADDVSSLDFVHERLGKFAQKRVDALALVIPTINRWSSMLRGMALDAREELQGQEVLEWNIPEASDAMTAQSDRVTVCSVNVIGLPRREPRAPGQSRVFGVSYRDLSRLRGVGGIESRGAASVARAGEESQLMDRQDGNDARGLRIELAVRAPKGSPGVRTAGGTLPPAIVVRTTSVPEDHRQAANTYCYEEISYNDPKEAFEAFLKLAGESAILVNLAPLNT